MSERYSDALELPRDDDGRLEGYSIGGTRSRGIYDWQERKEARAFKRLTDRLAAQRWYAALSAEEKQRIYEYRRQWAKDHPERVRQIARKAKRKRRASGKEAASARRRRTAQREQKRRTLVYECRRCAAAWSPVGRLAPRPPQYCSQACKSAASYERAKLREECPVAERALPGERLAQVLALDGELTPRRIADELGLSRMRAGRLLTWMTARGHLVRVARGVYLADSDD